MSFLQLDPREIRAPEALVLPDSRKRLTRYLRLNNKATLPAEMGWAWGTTDPFPSAPTGWSGLRLTNREIDDHARLLTVSKGEDSLPILKLIFEQIDASAETAVGGTEIVHLEDGRTAKILNYLQFSTGTYTPGTVGTSTAPGDSSAFLLKEEAPDDGTLRRIKRTYVYAGILRQVDETHNNGMLLIRRLTWAKTAPSTPSGYTLYEQSVENPAGSGVYTYSFAKGTGEISRELEYRQSDDLGTTGVTLTTIRTLSTASVDTDPSSLSGSVKISSSKTEQDGYRIWTTIYAKGTGLVAQYIHSRQDGLREVTNLALGTRVAPTGVVIRDDYEKREGYTLYTVSAIQSAAGGDPTSVSLSFTRNVPFTYPGRAARFIRSNPNSGKTIDVFQSPPVTTQVPATITVTYQTSSTFSISDLWDPGTGGWATIDAEWVGGGSLPACLVKPLPGYRSVDESVLSGQAGAIVGLNLYTMMGNALYGMSYYRLKVTGGPPDPGLHTYTLDATVEPAFIATDGTVYYRLTKVVAAIPAQTALPSLT